MPSESVPLRPVSSQAIQNDQGSSHRNQSREILSHGGQEGVTSEAPETAASKYPEQLMRSQFLSKWRENVYLIN